jgi:hypothetical protein
MKVQLRLSLRVTNTQERWSKSPCIVTLRPLHPRGCAHNSQWAQYSGTTLQGSISDLRQHSNFNYSRAHTGHKRSPKPSVWGRKVTMLLPGTESQSTDRAATKQILDKNSLDTAWGDNQWDWVVSHDCFATAVPHLTFMRNGIISENHSAEHSITRRGSPFARARSLLRV